MRCEEKAMKAFGSPRRAARDPWRAGTAAAVMLAGAALAACQTTEPAAPVAELVPTVPQDYRLRHPIKLREGTRAVELFIGSHRTHLTPAPRAQAASFAHGRRRQATGGVASPLPPGPTNHEAARR